MKRIWITGASGQLGLALYSLLQDSTKYELYRTGLRTGIGKELPVLDISDKEAVENYVEQIKPEIIINCAAMTAVDLCESEEERAYNINALGPKYLAQAAEVIGAKLIHISTDYVFDGMANEPYTEASTPNPASAYGRTKQLGDNFVESNCSRYFILRTAWIYGEGKNFVKTMLRLADSGNPIRVVADQFGTPTSALELARVIVLLMETENYGIYHATCEGSTSWYEFATTIFKELKMETEVLPITTKEYPTPAKRPKYSVLDNQALRERHGYTMKEWQEALREYLEQMK